MKRRPGGKPDQADFLNQVLLIETKLESRAAVKGYPSN